jgi:hypothetical protein
MKRLEVYALIAIILLGAFLRLTYLSAPSLWVDEAISVDIAQNAQNGLPQTSGGQYRSAYVLHYSMGIAMFFSNSEAGARFISVLAGLATIVLAFFIGKEYSKSGGIIAALFTSIFYLEVFFSRQARYYQLFQLAFFLSLYLLYKSKETKWLIYPAILVLFIAIDTHLQGLLLTFFFIGHILLYNNKWLAILPTLPLLQKLIPTTSLASGSPETATNLASQYISYTTNSFFFIILAIPGLIWSFFKNKRLTTLLIVPAIITLAGVFTLETFAFRYAYFFIFPIILFSSLFLAYMYDTYGKGIIVAIILIAVLPSNILLPYTYATMLVPTTAQFYDPSAPYNDYKTIPEDVLLDMQNTTLISYFAPDVQFYIKKPNYVLPFSLDGRSEDQISITKNNQTIDRYSGAPILTEIPERPYYLTADDFSVRKLRTSQREFHESLIENCSISHQDHAYRIYSCN